MTVKPEPSESIRYELRDGVARITIDRPARRNAFDDPTAAALHAALRRAGDDGGCRVVVLAAAGPVFCAGWDLKELARMREQADPAATRASFVANRALLADLAALPQPTIACVQGPAIGFGLGLLARCDVAIAGRSVPFALPEIVHGVVPGIVMLDLLRTLPAKTALDWLLSGATQTAEDALAAGLLSRVVADDRLTATVDELSATIAGHGLETVRETKRLYRELRTSSDADAEATAIDAAVAALLA